MAQQEERLDTLEVDNSMTREELHSAAAESERLRLLMYAEQRHLKEALRQKKELNAHLRQALLEQRREQDQQQLQARRREQELRERVRAMEMQREREAKELSRSQQREHTAESSTHMVRLHQRERESY